MSSATQTFLAVDLGASSGRVVAGRFDGSRIHLEEQHRFANGGVLLNDRLYWNVLGLWQHIQDGMRRAASEIGAGVQSIGVDTWGVDFALLGKDGNLLSNPLCYRDSHTDGILDEAFQVMPREEIFAETGLQFMPFNSLYQLVAMKRDASPTLEAADSLLMIPDLFHWMLTGVKTIEHTNATTTQMLNPLTGNWSPSVLERFGLPSGIFRPLPSLARTLEPFGLACKPRLA